VLHERTEGWAAGLRLAALALAGHPDPGRFAAEFSGTERTVAEYLLAEVLDRQPENVRRLLLRTSILERVNGKLAALLTGDKDAERVLQDLEAANAFTVSLDAARSWFRYHQMFAALLQLELRRDAPGEVAGLHRAAAGWFAEHGYPVEAVQHAQAAQDWPLATRLLAGHWPGLYLDGQAGAIRELLAGFPAETRAANAELAVMAAAGELTRGSLEAAERYLTLAERGSALVPQARSGQLRLLLGVVRLQVGRQRGDLPAVTEQARTLQATAEHADPEAAQPGLSEDLRALTLISLGSTEHWATVYEDAERHLERGIALARKIGRPYLEFTGLAFQATMFYRSFARAAESGRQAIELARRHGWTDDPAVGVACTVLGIMLLWQGRADEAEPLLQRAERTLTAEAQPAEGLAIRYLRGMLELVRNRDAEALAAFEAAEQLGRRLAGPHYFIPRTRALLIHSLIRLGQTERAGQFLAAVSDQDGSRGEMRSAAAELWLAQDDPRAAVSELVPVLDGPAPAYWRGWLTRFYVLEAIARDALGDPAAAATAIERALDLAEPDGLLLPFLLYPAPGLLERHVRHRTAHAALVAEIRGLLAGTRPAPTHSQPKPLVKSLVEPLSGSELRVLRYLPTNLTTPEIARELSVSSNTVRTHIRHLYAKLGAHSRADTVESARALGLLAPIGARTSPAPP
jgi:LuxR family transcriptional regulator, maltose regulon positive regulatory protein